MRPKNNFVFISIILTIIFFSTSVNSEILKFTDPDEKFDMPKEWQEKPIKYEQWAEGADIALSLDQHLYPAYVDIIQEYAKKNNIIIKVNEGTCGISAGALNNKNTDIAGFCCPPGKSDRMPGIRFHTMGISAVRILVHPDNPISNVTLKEARQIFAGEITRWSELKNEKGESGPDMFILPIGRLHCKARPGHWRLLLDNENDFSADLQEVGSISEMIDSVATRQNAIGYETEWMVVRYKYAGKVKSLSIDGFSPDIKENLLNTNYPLYRTYVITTWERDLKNPHTDKLIKYLYENLKNIDKKFHIIDSKSLLDNGWKFIDDELIGELEK